MNCLEKLKSNVEKAARAGGIIVCIADKHSQFQNDKTMRVINVPHCEPASPLSFTTHSTARLLSYYVAIILKALMLRPTHENLAKFRNALE